MNERVGQHHLNRKAIVYVRQSSQYQVMHNEESRRLQYAMEERLRSLGWKEIEVVDDDLGRSASGLIDRVGFQRMVAEVGLGNVGAVAAREVSRFARNNRDWHQLVEMCGLVDTLLVDHESVYDARRGNDRLLLGLKGSLSEYELDLLRQRSLDARWAKARRGELVTVAPVGYVNRDDGSIEKDPDQRVRRSIDLVFSKFFELGSSRQVLMWMLQMGLELPTKRYGSAGWEVIWKRPVYQNVHRLLTDPTYAGAYVYGRTITRVEVRNGSFEKKTARRARDDWPVLIRDHHEGYIAWEQFERIEEMHAQNVSKFEKNKRGAARRGPALLAGLCRCRRCGQKLLVAYSGRNSDVPRYVCQRGHLDSGDPSCISFGGLPVDEAVVGEVLRVVAPCAIDAAILAAEQEQQTDDGVIEQLSLEQEAARYAADRAWRQYDAVDPANRLVADELERRWNDALIRLSEIDQRIEDLRAALPKSDPPDVEIFVALAGELDEVWRSPDTDVRLKKRILRTLIEEIIVDIDGAAHEVIAVVHWKGGVHTEIRVPRRRRGQNRAHSKPSIVEAVRSLSRVCDDEVIASFLNRNGLRTGRGNRWTRERVTSLRSKRKIPRCSSDLERREWMTLTQAAAIVGTSAVTLRRAAERGEIVAEHPLADGPWVLNRKDVHEFAKRASALPTKPDSSQLDLDIPTT